VTLIIRRSGAPTLVVQPQPLPAERNLQEYIFQTPEVIPIQDITDHAKLFIAAREFQTSSGPIDLLGLDGDGTPYIIETKLFRNFDKRQVIGQVLDYGAALRRDLNHFGEFYKQLDLAVQTDRGEGLSQAVAAFFELAEEQGTELLEAAFLALRDGAFRFLVLMDQMDSRLRDLISFVNESSKFSIYAVEVVAYQIQDGEIFLPKVYGAEVEKKYGTSASERGKWNEEKFFAKAAESLDPEHLQRLRKLYDWSERHATINWGTGRNWGSFNPAFFGLSRRAPFTAWSNGNLTLKLRWLSDGAEAEAFRRRLYDRLQAAGVPVGSYDTKKDLSFEPHEWATWIDRLMEETEKAAAESHPAA
jgi:hypothetical protein